MRVMCLAKEHDTVTQQGIEPRPLHPDFKALTVSLLPSYKKMTCEPLKLYLKQTKPKQEREQKAYTTTTIQGKTK